MSQNKHNIRIEADKKGNDRLVFDYVNLDGKTKTVAVPAVETVDDKKVNFNDIAKDPEAVNAFLDATADRYRALAQKSRDDYNAKPEEEKAALKAEAKQRGIENWENKSEAEKEAARERGRAEGAKQKAAYDALPEEEKAALKAEAKERGIENWNNKSEAEKEAARERGREEGAKQKAAYEALPEEEKAALKAEAKERGIENWNNKSEAEKEAHREKSRQASANNQAQPVMLSEDDLNNIFDKAEGLQQ